MAFFAAAVPAPAAPASATIQCDAISSAVLGRPVNVCVALPPGYESSSQRYPTLYFLHGLFEDEQSWSERGGEQILEGLWDKDKIGKFLVVLPDGGRTFYVNGYGGHERYEDFFIKELVPAIDSKYRTIPTVAARGISGTSMGGYGALHLAMRHPDVFGSASAHSAALVPHIPDPMPTEGRWRFYSRILGAAFGSPLSESYWDQNNPLTLADRPEKFQQLKLYFDCGDSDRYGFDEGARLLHEKLLAEGFTHEYALRVGGHGWSYLSQYLHYSLEFHWRWFEQAEHSLAASTAAGGRR